MLTALLIVSLILERALEVFVTTWRGPAAKKMGEEMKSLTGADRERKGLEKTEYKSSTQRVALWTGLTLGLLVSAVGIRTLQALVDPTALDQLPKAQAAAFSLLDVLLTGGLIAGGSEGIHKITQVFTNFMEATAEKAKGEPA